MADLTKTIKDAAYITVGLGVIGFQRAQVRRQEARKRLHTQLTETKGQVQKLAGEFEKRVGDLEKRVETGLGQVESRLPAAPMELVKQARVAADDVQSKVQAKVRARLGRPAQPAA